MKKQGARPGRFHFSEDLMFVKWCPLCPVFVISTSISMWLGNEVICPSKVSGYPSSKCSYGSRANAILWIGNRELSCTCICRAETRWKGDFCLCCWIFGKKFAPFNAKKVLKLNICWIAFIISRCLTLSSHGCFLVQTLSAVWSPCCFLFLFILTAGEEDWRTLTLLIYLLEKPFLDPCSS